jgi:hypothetical protein
VKWRSIAPVLPVADVSSTAAYFRDKLGFSVRSVMPESGDHWVVLERDGVEIHLVPKDWPAGALVLVDSVDLLVGELKERGAQFESGPTDQQYGMRDFAVSEPNGFQIGFWQPLLPMSFWDKAFPHRLKVDPSLPEDEQPF